MSSLTDWHGFAGKPISILDGVFMTIKDDIDCYPYPSNGTTKMTIVC